jgi:hypothetical protein
MRQFRRTYARAAAGISKKSREIQTAPQLPSDQWEWGIAYDRRCGSGNFRGGLSAAFDGADAAPNRPLEMKGIAASSADA